MSPIFLLSAARKASYEERDINKLRGYLSDNIHTIYLEVVNFHSGIYRSLIFAQNTQHKLNLFHARMNHCTDIVHGDEFI